MTRYKAITEKGSKQEMLTQFFQNEIRRRDDEALTALLKSASGRWFLMRLLDNSYVLGQCFTGNSTTFYNEGKREVGLQVLRDITRLGVKAVKLKQTAELEYIEFQAKARELAEDYAERETE